MTKIVSVEISDARTGKVEHRKRLNPRAQALVGLLAITAFAGGHAGLDKLDASIKSASHINMEIDDFSKYNLGSTPTELAKIYKKEGINPLDLTFHTIKAGEPNPTYIAQELGAKDVNQVAGEIDVQTSAIVNDIPVNSMHPGQVIVIPNDQLKVTR